MPEKRDTYFDEGRGRTVLDREHWRGLKSRGRRSILDAFSWGERDSFEPSDGGIPTWVLAALAFAITFCIGMVWVLA